MLAGGSWCMPAPMLKAVRQAVLDNIDEYKSIVDDTAFKQFFPVVGMESLKTAPKGFPKDSPLYLDRIGEVFRQLKRFVDFTNYTIDEME